MISVCCTRISTIIVIETCFTIHEIKFDAGFIDEHDVSRLITTNDITIQYVTSSQLLHSFGVGHVNLTLLFHHHRLHCFLFLFLQLTIRLMFGTFWVVFLFFKLYFTQNLCVEWVLVFVMISLVFSRTLDGGFALCLINRIFNLFSQFVDGAVLVLCDGVSRWRHFVNLMGWSLARQDRSHGLVWRTLRMIV